MRILRPLVSIVLLALVAYKIPWSDQLLAGGLSIPGEIVGDWRGNTIEFRPLKEAAIPPGWPADSRPALAARESVSVTRAAPEGGRAAEPSALDWRPGMLRVFRELDPTGLWAAFALLLAAAFVSITRWWRLLRVAGCNTSWLAANRLTFLGFFFNQVVPGGITGGDLVKAVLVVREHPGRRAEAFVSVIVDRALGLIVITGLAAIVVWVSGDHFARLQLPVTLTFAGMLFAVWAFVHPGPRRFLRIEALIDRLPQKERLKSIDAAVRIYGDHKVEIAIAIVLSVFNHVGIAAAIFALGGAFGANLSPLEYLGLTAIANLISSLPVAPGGWGVGEAAFGYLFHLLGRPATLGVAVSITYRLLTMVLGLIGGVFLLLPGGRDVREELEHEKEHEALEPER
jgi:glycosyltransferase 2 family protein